MSHPTLSGFFPTQTYLVLFISHTNLRVMVYCFWLGLPPVCRDISTRCFEGSPFFGGRPSCLSPCHSNAQVLLGLGRKMACFWFKGGKTSTSLLVCPLEGLRSCAFPLPSPPRPPAVRTKDQQPHDRSQGRVSRQLGAAWGPRWVHMRLPSSESFPGKAQHEASSTTMELLLPLLMN